MGAVQNPSVRDSAPARKPPSTARLAAAALLASLAAGSLCAQPGGTAFVPGKRDSGWRPLFNGTSLQGLSVHIDGGTFGDNSRNLVTVHDSTIHFFQGKKRANGDPGPNGVVSTPGEFGHYHCRVEYRHGDAANDGWLAGDPYNTGFFYHAKPSAGMFPPAIEYQLKRHWNSRTNRPCSAAAGDCNQLWAGDFWLLSGVQITKNGAMSPLGGCCQPMYGNHSPDRELEGWNRMEVEVHGDSLFRNLLNGYEVNFGTKSTWQNTQGQRVPLKSGRVQLELEGSEVQFRNWEIRLLPKDSLYQAWYVEGCRDPDYVEYAAEATLHVASKCVTRKSTSLSQRGDRGRPGKAGVRSSTGPRWLRGKVPHDAGGRRLK